MTKSYSKQKRQILINRYLSGDAVSAIIVESKIPRSTFYSWIAKHNEALCAISPKPFNLRGFRELERKTAKLENIVKILQSAPCTASAPLKEKLFVLEELYEQYDNVHMICEALDVPRGTFYNHIRRNKKDCTSYAKRREEFRIKIQEVYDDSNQIFGAEKITAVLQNNGECVSKKFVLELMRDMGLVSIRQNSKGIYLKEKLKMKNHLNRNFHTDAPNQVWVSDVTYFKFDDKSYYICVIIDLFSRKVVGHRVSIKNSTQLIKSTFKQAYENRKPQEKLVFHSDRGSNYRSATFRHHLETLDVEQSFSKAHVPYDNSVAESFFASMKREELYRTKYRSENEFKKSIDNYIIFYNTKRPHKTVKNKTPEQFEMDFARNSDNSNNQSIGQEGS